MHLIRHLFVLPGHNFFGHYGRAALTKVGESPFKRSFTSMTLKPRPVI